MSRYKKFSNQLGKKDAQILELQMKALLLNPELSLGVVRTDAETPTQYARTRSGRKCGHFCSVDMWCLPSPFFSSAPPAMFCQTVFELIWCICTNFCLEANESNVSVCVCVPDFYRLTVSSRLCPTLPPNSRQPARVLCLWATPSCLGCWETPQRSMSRLWMLSCTCRSPGEKRGVEVMLSFSIYV